jgi:hypothetical protein
LPFRQTRESFALIMVTQPSNQSLQLTAGRCDDELEFMKQIVEVEKARSR